MSAFWGTALFGFLVAAAATAASRFGVSHDAPRRVLLGLAGVVAVLLGVLLMDAAGSFSGHGPGMHGAVRALWVCVGLYLAGGLLIGVPAFVARRGTPQQT